MQPRNALQKKRVEIFHCLLYFGVNITLEQLHLCFPVYQSIYVRYETKGQPSGIYNLIFLKTREGVFADRVSCDTRFQIFGARYCK